MMFNAITKAGATELRWPEKPYHIRRGRIRPANRPLAWHFPGRCLYALSYFVPFLETNAPDHDERNLG
jgi:hypothetical protein